MPSLFMLTVKCKPSFSLFIFDWNLFLTLFRLGEGALWCPRQLWLARNFRQFKIILPYHRTFPQIYLAIWWCGRILIMGSAVAMATAFWRACLAEIWISCLFFTLNWIVMLGIEYFGNLEHYCFKKNIISDFFSWSVTSRMTSYKFRGKLWNLANDVIVYFRLSEFFLLQFFVYFVYFRPFSTEIS